jgi:hypothetical protein
MDIQQKIIIPDIK